MEFHIRPGACPYAIIFGNDFGSQIKNAVRIRRSVCVSKILWNSSKCVSKILWNSSKCVRRNKRNVLRRQCSDTNRNIKWLQCAADTDSELKSNVSSVGPSSELETYSRLTILHYDSF